MKNKYYANITLCETSSEDYAEVRHPFNNLEVVNDDYIPFEAIISLSREIEEPKKVTFVFGIHHENEYNAISIMNREYNSGKGTEFTRCKVDCFKEIGEGIYIAEVRFGENVKLLSEINTPETIRDMLGKTEILNRCMFEVKYSEEKNKKR